MVQSIDKIEQELAKLEAAIVSICQQLTAIYPPYLHLLGKTVRRQLIMAVYQICTNVYPEIFLQLSLGQRHELQGKVKQITQGIRLQLLAPLLDLEKIISPTPLVGTKSSSEINPAMNSEITTTKAESTTLANNSNTSANNLTSIDRATQLKKLVTWQRQTESEIGQILQQSSQEVNNLLCQAGLLTQKLPTMLLEAAAKVESLNPAAVIGMPNTLNLMVEVDDGSESSDESSDFSGTVDSSDSPPAKTARSLTVVYLRLGDLEFNDPELGSSSNQIRSLVGKLYALDRDYHRQLKTYRIAQAQAAWRSTWVED
jgi:hypothetical protein